MKVYLQFAHTEYERGQLNVIHPAEESVSTESQNRLPNLQF
jgi:hypothetical protein